MATSINDLNTAVLTVPSIVPDRYTDSVSGTGVDLIQGDGPAFCFISTELLDALPSYTVQIQESDTGSGWTDSDTDPVTITETDPAAQVIRFTRRRRFVRASLNVVDGPGDIRIAADFVQQRKVIE